MWLWGRVSLVHSLLQDQEITEDTDSNISALARVKSAALSEAGEMVREEFSAATTRGI